MIMSRDSEAEIAEFMRGQQTLGQESATSPIKFVKYCNCASSSKPSDKVASRVFQLPVDTKFRLFQPKNHKN